MKSIRNLAWGTCKGVLGLAIGSIGLTATTSLWYCMFDSAQELSKGNSESNQAVLGIMMVLVPLATLITYGGVKLMENGFKDIYNQCKSDKIKKEIKETAPTF